MGGFYVGRMVSRLSGEGLYGGGLDGRGVVLGGDCIVEG